MGLLRNLRLLLADNVLNRMTDLEDRMDLLEEHTAGRLDSMKQYAARVQKRDRDARGAARNGDQLTGLSPGTPHLSEAAQRLLARRQARHGTAG